MAKGLRRSALRIPALKQTIQKQTVSLSGLSITVDGATGVGFGTVVAGALPEGNILFLGAVAYVSVSTSSASVIDTFTGSYSVGTTGTTDATLSSTDADIIGSTALTAATAKVSPVIRGVNASQSILDNTDRTQAINLNLIIADASISADDIIFVAQGVLELSYVMLLDD